VPVSKKPISGYGRARNRPLRFALARMPLRKRIPLTVVFAATLVLASSAVPAQAATALYPDLKTLPPRDLRFDRTDVDPESSTALHNVLRFSNTVWNAGSGPLEVRSQIDPKTQTGAAIQRVYDDGGGFVNFGVGNFYWHAVHSHYHFDEWGRYELWTKAGYDAWIASGRTTGTPMLGAKTTSCMIDEEFIRNLPNQPYPATYDPDGCFPDSQGAMLQGIAVGWGDTYDYFRFEQWIDLGPSGSLADGQYVLRSVSDPLNKLYESQGKADPAREGILDNEAIVAFAVQGGKLVDSNSPSGSVRINDIAASTGSPNVTVKVLGRDDVSGVTQVRLSNNGSTWSTPQSYTGSQSTAQPISWDLTNAAFGGTNTDGVKTVYAQFRDASGKWSASETDTISLNRGGGGSAYSSTVLGDGPGGYWRLGETSGTTAADASGGDNGTYVNSPTQGQASLLPGDSANRSVRFDGANDLVRVNSSSALTPSSRVSLEAWIKPASLPAAGGFASILTKAESYSLQFNGPRLEFTIIQNGARRRLQAPTGAIVAGQTYHVVGTYDGATQRLYVNGTQVASAALSGAITTNANPVAIGSWNGSVEFFNGTIDEAAVYPVALSAARVAAHRSAGIGEAPPDTSVKAPSNLSATVVSDTQINLTWTDNSSNEGEFLIERATDPSFASPVIDSVWSNSTFFSASGLTPATTYYFRVKARNSTDSSAYSNAVSAATLSTPPPPPPGGYGVEVAVDGPVSWWRLGEASGSVAADARGANPGTYLNTPSLGQPGLIATDASDKAVTFDGVNESVRIPNSASLGLSSSLSLEAWIKPATLPATGAFASILTKAESYSLQFNGPRLEFTIMQGGVRRRLQAPTGAIVAGQAYHVVGTYDGATQRLYVNGTQVASAALSGPAGASTNPLYVGSWNGTSELFKGTIDEPAVYSTTLSASRVAAHYAAASSAESSSLTATPAAPRLDGDLYPVSGAPTFLGYCRLHQSRA
jgi:hypothetical protein